MSNESTAHTGGVVPEGRQLITGRVLSAREDRLDDGTAVLRMLVADDRGFRVWGIPPRALRSFHYWDGEGEFRQHIGAVVGDRVQFIALVEPSVDDETFGLFRRAFRGIINP